MSRKINSLKNFQSSIISEIISIVLKFITRSIFIAILGTEYLGISSLATNILSMLSLSEMGFGAAITFHLYKPLADGDINKLKSILGFFSRIYKYIGFIISIPVILLIPFLSFFIKDDVGSINVKLIFAFYLFQTVSSYFFYGYKHSVIRANQKEYIISITKSYFSILNSILQIAILLITKDFYFYVLITVLSNVLMNMSIARKADKLYGYLRDKNVPEIEREEKIRIFKDAYAIFFYKIYDKVLNSTDTIIISKYIGLTMLGIYSNYLMILNTLQIFLSKFYTSILASLSDLYAREENERSYMLFKTINLITTFTFGFFAITINNTINTFIILWIGPKYTLNESFVVLFSILILLNGYRVFFDTFRTSMGLFQKAKYRPIFGAIINISLSLIFVRIFGISGVLLATVIANCLTYMWYDPYIILKFGFSKGITIFLVDNFKYLLSLIGSAFLVKLAISFFELNGLVEIIVNIALSMVFMILTFGLLYFKTEEFKFLQSTSSTIIKSIWTKILKKTNLNRTI